MASISKRQQARNEGELHELSQRSGNSQCADCGARNPGWASWNLGIFVCMRCASIHRKLGTHISKVKSLSMDKWTAEQVENMKNNGNIAVNNIYNPKHKIPDMPLDADEVDSAMERFIRKKYQEKSLLDGKPEPPSRDLSSKPLPMVSPDSSPPPPPPPKKGRFFGFGVRASSSAYPSSKNDQKKLPQEPRVDSTFPISADSLSAVTGMTQGNVKIPEKDLQRKLAALRDMGFDETERNIFLLQKLNGNVERTVEALVQSGQNSASRDRSKSTTGAAIDANRYASTGTPQPTTATVPANTSSNNPFDQLTGSSGFGASTAESQQMQHQQQSRPIRSNTNPFEQPNQNQSGPGLEQSFQNLQLSQPLFPNVTGGYPGQQPPPQDHRLQYSSTPPVPTIPQQYNYSPAGPASSNPFQFAQPQQLTGNNPWASQVQNQPPPTNPFFGTQFNQNQQASSNLTPQPTASASSFNPFGIPPPQSPAQVLQQPNNLQYGLQHNVNNSPQTAFQTNNPYQSAVQSPLYPNTQQQTHQFNSMPQMNLFQQQPQYNQLPPQGNPYYPQQSTQLSPQSQPQSQPLIPQQTGRYDKNSILALYNYPQLAPQPLASIPEPSENPNYSSNISTQPGTSPNNTYSSPMSSTKRSASMPVSNMHSSGGNGSRNPFFANNNQVVGQQPTTPTQQYQQQQRQQQQQPGILARHSSRDSVNVNNLDSGRHSPDAFANLSSRYVG